MNTNNDSGHEDHPANVQIDLGNDDDGNAGNSYPGENGDGDGDDHPPIASVSVKPEPRTLYNNALDQERGNQLPDVEEYKAAQAPRSRPRSKMSQRRCKRRLILAVAITIVVIVSVTVGVIIGRDTASGGGSEAAAWINGFGGAGGNTNAGGYDGDESPSSTTASGNAEQGYWNRRDTVMKLVTDMRWSDPLKVNEQNTPQNAAAVWMAEGDPLRLEVKDTEEFRQRYALAVLFYSLSGYVENGELYGGMVPWLTSDDVCEWRKTFSSDDGDNVDHGVKCFGGKVVKELYLPNTRGSGARGGDGGSVFPDELKLLYDLEAINLRGNNINGALPAGIDYLQNLRDLDASYNNLQGSFPDFLGLKTLETLDLSHNDLDGGLPSILDGMSSLKTFNIGYNNFKDDIKKFSVLDNVRFLDISNCSFVGTLTSDLLGDWKHIETLDLSDNQIQGALPANLFEMDKLNTIDLHGNFFNGTLPKQVKPESDLSFLALHENELKGDISVIAQSLTKLTHLDLSSNWFSGPMDSFEQLSNLRYLFLAFNSNFERGTIPQSIVTLPNLVDLSLQMTGRTGAIPTGFGFNKNLAFLDLGYNYLDSQIPEDIGEATSLQFLLLNRNEGLTGPIPQSFSSLNKLSALLLDRTELNGPSDPICSNKPASLNAFIADCDEISCPLGCCTQCCEDGDQDTVTQCNDVAWNGALDPVSEYKYKRSRYHLIQQTIVSENNDEYNGDTQRSPPTDFNTDPSPLPATPPKNEEDEDDGIFDGF